MERATVNPSIPRRNAKEEEKEEKKEEENHLRIVSFVTPSL